MKGIYEVKKQNRMSKLLGAAKKCKIYDSKWLFSPEHERARESTLTQLSAYQSKNHKPWPGSPDDTRKPLTQMTTKFSYHF